MEIDANSLLRIMRHKSVSFDDIATECGVRPNTVKGWFKRWEVPEHQLRGIQQLLGASVLCGIQPYMLESVLEAYRQVYREHEEKD